MKKLLLLLYVAAGSVVLLTSLAYFVHPFLALLCIPPVGTMTGMLAAKLFLEP